MDPLMLSGNDKIYNLVTQEKVGMVARFGSTEIQSMIYSDIPEIISFPLRKRIHFRMKNNAGFFPVNNNSLYEFSKLMKTSAKCVDILGSWRKEEHFYGKILKRATRVPLRSLEPYYFNNPWSRSLEDKNVLVIHPLKDEIEHQYQKRHLIFENRDVLPNFKSLKVIKAVQSAADEKVGYSTWFEALESMKDKVNSSDFDVAIIGCGAYGFPLAAYVKRIGKIAVHLGGATQILFGIKGARWDHHEIISKLYNNHWIRPSKSNAPKGHKQIEGGCYW